MSQRFVISNGQTLTATMSSDFAGGVLAFSFTGSPVGIPRVFRTFAGSEIEVPQFGKNEWRFNGACEGVRIDLTGVTGYSAYSATCWRHELPVPMIPDGAFSGDRAMPVQFYDEVNKKRGTQWEASRLVTIADNSAPNNVYSIILTGSKPVDLKSRVLGYSGLGVVGRIYKSPTYTGGAPDPWFNLNPRYLGTEPEAKLLTGFTLTANGTKCGADIFGIGPGSQQSRGSTPQSLGSNRILDEPNTAYLLEIASLDPGSQQVMARLEMYEGGLDFPLTL